MTDTQEYDYPHVHRREATQQTQVEAKVRKDYFDSEIRSKLSEMLTAEGYEGIGFSFIGSVQQGASVESSDIDIVLTGFRNLDSEKLRSLVPTVNRLIQKLEPKYHIHVWDHAGAGWTLSRSTFNTLRQL